MHGQNAEYASTPKRVERDDARGWGYHSEWANLARVGY
jgi:hypothetical protein